MQCGLKGDGTAWCWGGRLGLAGRQRSYVPTKVPVVSDFTSLVADGDRACGFRVDGSVWCWGDWLGFPGGGRKGPFPFPGGPWRSLSLESSCGVKQDGTVWCWGTYPFLDASPDQALGVPAQVGDRTDWSMVSGTYKTYCGIRVDGTLWCWGQNKYGSMGVPGVVKAKVEDPVQVVSAVPWRSVTGDYHHFCGVQVDGTLWCWGNRFDLIHAYDGHPIGVGDGSRVSRFAPVRIGTRTYTSVTMHDTNTCALATTGKAYCWGLNNDGQNGDGTTKAAAQPRARLEARWVVPAGLATPRAPAPREEAGAGRDCREGWSEGEPQVLREHPGQLVGLDG